MKIGTAERLPTDSDLSATAYGEALRILKPKAGELGCVDLVLAFGPGCWYMAHELQAQANRTASIVMQLVFDWENFEEDEWLLMDRVTGRSVWSPGNPIDAADGIPCYYMRLDVAKQEIMEKLLWRCCKIRAE